MNEPLKIIQVASFMLGFSIKSGADAINISGLLNPKKLGNFKK